MKVKNGNRKDEPGVVSSNSVTMDNREKQLNIKTDVHTSWLSRCLNTVLLLLWGIGVQFRV
jgi:hypothetical protein